MSSFRVLLVGGIALLLLLASACQSGLSEDEAKVIVDVMLSDPRFEEIAMSDERMDLMIDSMLSHPTMQTTAKEDCATAVVIASVQVGDLTPPSDEEAEALCEWYGLFIDEP